jgi:hypothetical protein
MNTTFFGPDYGTTRSHDQNEVVFIESLDVAAVPPGCTMGVQRLGSAGKPDVEEDDHAFRTTSI